MSTVKELIAATTKVADASYSLDALASIMVSSNQLPLKGDEASSDKPFPMKDPCIWCNARICSHCQCTGDCRPIDDTKGHSGRNCDTLRYGRRLKCNQCYKRSLKSTRDSGTAGRRSPKQRKIQIETCLSDISTDSTSASAPATSALDVIASAASDSIAIAVPEFSPAPTPTTSATEAAVVLAPATAIAVPAAAVDRIDVVALSADGVVIAAMPITLLNSLVDVRNYIDTRGLLRNRGMKRYQFKHPCGIMLWSEQEPDFKVVSCCVPSQIKVHPSSHAIAEGAAPPTLYMLELAVLSDLEATGPARAMKDPASGTA